MPTGITGHVGLHVAAPSLAAIHVAQEHHRNGSVELSVGVTATGRWGAADLAARGLSLQLELCYPECGHGRADVAGAAGVADVLGSAAGTPAPPLTEYQRRSLEPEAMTQRAAVLSDAAVAQHPAIADALSGAPFRTRLLIAAPRLWWPRDHGEQPLYQLRATLRCTATPSRSADHAGECSARDAQPTPLRRQIGLRTVALVQEPAQPPEAGQPAGTSFYFRVNGVPVFAKGTNLIPMDVFKPRATAERAAWLLERAAAAHMNMVRVWGGGIYQPDWFYDLADKLGIMLWQEMVFACALYPRDAAFLERVRTEVGQQVARLATHPSIVIWGGSNENEYAIQVRR